MAETEIDTTQYGTALQKAHSPEIFQFIDHAGEFAYVLYHFYIYLRNSVVLLAVIDCLLGSFNWLN
jgi:hypothetical protein